MTIDMLMMLNIDFYSTNDGNVWYRDPETGNIKYAYEE